LTYLGLQLEQIGRREDFVLIKDEDWLDHPALRAGTDRDK
jgi:hypothetical protein